jgi:3-hydroxyanthranilate 3,4-dioxygenase
MVVGGPNSRKDYHDDPGDEFFYQLEGDMLLRTMQEGRRVDIPIRSGEMLLLPAHVPHSPQRYADTVGLVVERRRRNEADGFLWFCERCDARLYSEYLHVTDIEQQLPPVFGRFWSDPEHTTCRQCGMSYGSDRLSALEFSADGRHWRADLRAPSTSPSRCCSTDLSRASSCRRQPAVNPCSTAASAAVSTAAQAATVRCRRSRPTATAPTPNAWATSPAAQA